MTAELFGAEEALKGGLVRSIHAPEELVPAAQALAKKFADRNSSSVAAANEAARANRQAFEAVLADARAQGATHYALLGDFVGYGADPDRFAQWWPVDYHLVGKDILRFHAVYWPAMLMAADLAVPRTVFAHGWLLVGGEKMSKSKLTGIAPSQIVDHFGSDAFRYYFLRAIQFGSDGSFSWEDMSARRRGDEQAGEERRQGGHGGGLARQPLGDAQVAGNRRQQAGGQHLGGGQADHAQSRHKNRGPIGFFHAFHHGIIQ